MSILATCALVMLTGMPGGRVDHFQNLVDALNRVGCTARIERECASACIMFLGVKGACVSPRATLIFHGPSYYGIPMKEEAFDAWSDWISNNYPPRIKRWYMQTGRHATHAMSGREAIRLGARSCDAQNGGGNGR